MAYYGGLTINGATSFVNLGQNVTGIGDINGDSIDDVAVSTGNPSSPYSDNQGVFVIFGSEGGTLPTEISTDQLDGTNGFRITVDRAGFYGEFYGTNNILTNVGDLNGDGVDDLGIGGFTNRFNYGPTAPGAFVLFGSSEGFAASETVGANMDGTDGFAIFADPDTDIVGMDAAGDVNGDGIDDLLINQASGNGGYYGPQVALAVGPGGPNVGHVIFGDDASGVDALGADGTFDVADIDGTNGFGIAGGFSEISGYYGEIYYAGVSAGGVVALGDVDGDGFDDLGLSVVDAYYTTIEETDENGDPVVDGNGDPVLIDGVAINREAYVLFGDDSSTFQKTGDDNGTEVRWDDLSGGGFYENNYGYSVGRYDNTLTVEGIGDVNGDGFDDVAIGTTERALLGEFSPVAEDGDDAFGVVGIVFGGPDGVDTDGDGPLDGLNFNVALAARDQNGDPIFAPDVTIVNSTGLDSFRGFGSSITAAGDVNGDGLADFLITDADAPNATGSSGFGESFLILGQDSDGGTPFPLVLDLDNLSQPEVDQTFYRFFQDDDRFSGFGQSVSAAGDLNGDGFGDLIISENRADATDPTTGNNVTNSGAAYVVYGGEDALEAADNADGANDNAINVENLDVNALTGQVPIVVSVSNSGFRTLVQEGDSGPTVFTFEVQRTGDLTEEVSFDYEVAGSGFSPADETDFVGGAFPSGSVTFGASESRAEVEVLVNGDIDIESDNDFTFTVTDATTTGSSDVSIGVNTSFATIDNDDFPASIRITGGSASEDGQITFTVSRFNALDSTVSVDFDILGAGFRPVSASDIDDVLVDGVSIGGGLGQSGTITFAPDEVVKQIVIEPVDDTLIEPVETVRINLSNLTGDGPAVFSNSSAFGYINDNDFPPEIFVSGGGSFFEGSTPGGVTPVTFEIIRRGDTDGVTDVTYDLNPIPAAGDFFAADGNDIDSFLPDFGNVVRFEDGESVKQVTVNIIHDGIIEPRETFELRITEVESFNGTTYSVPVSSASVRIVNDDGRPPEIPDGVEADVFGDPHIVTLDGLGYDFQAVGEYILVESTIVDDPRDFNVQVRFEPLEGSDLVSVTTRMAVEVGGVNIEIDALGSDALLIDGNPISAEQLATGAVDVDGDGFLDVFFDESLGEFRVILNDLDEQLMIKNMDGVLNICVFLSDAPGGHADNVKGLMGNANGDLTDDLMTRSGDITYIDPTFEELYVDYADSWRVMNSERLFSDDVESGNFPDGFPAAKISIDDLPASVLAAAVAAVDAAGITDPIIRESAILDFALTGDENFVQGALGLAADPVEEITVTDAPETPLTIGVTPVETVVNEADGDPNTLNFTFYRIGDTTEDVVINYAIGGEIDAADLVAGTALTGEVTILAGQGSANLAVGVVNDTITEADERLVVSITGNDMGALVASGKGTTVIETDDFAPVAEDDVFTTGADTQLVGDLLVGNPTTPDTDANDDTLTVTTVIASNGQVSTTAGAQIVLPSGAFLTFASDGSFSYDPFGATTGAGSHNDTVFDKLGAGQLATDTFSYAISDGNGGVDIADVTITVTGVDDAPIAVNDAFSTNEDTSVAVDFLVNDLDAEDTELVPTIVAGPTNGELSVDDAGFWTYAPTADFFGTDSFTYTVSDGVNDSEIATATITVSGVNDGPVASAEQGFSLAENGTSVGSIVASDVDSSDLEYTISGGADAGLFAIVAETGALSFIDAPDFEAPGDAGANNQYDLQVTVSDGQASTDVDVAVTVTDVDDTPTQNEVTGSAGSDRDLVGTEGADIINSGAGFSDTVTGLGGADIFDFSDSSTNGVREVRFVTDFDASEGDQIDLGGAIIARERQVGDSTYLFLNEDRDLIILEGVSSFDTDSLL